MARSFGKKNVVSNDIFSYNIMLLGESGVGKTTLVSNVMRKFCNENEYLMLQIGKEEGCKAIPDLMWESIPTWKDFIAFVDEVVRNRDDWSELKCVAIDTLDALIDICTPYVIKAWNSSQMGKKDFSTPATTLNQCYGGFGKGDEVLMDQILEQIWKLKSVGVSVIVVGHTRRRENVDIVSGLTYSSMSASIALKNFEAIKTKMDIVAMAYIDREVATRDFGRENIVTHKQQTINEVTNEARKIAFRSSAYVLDCKSRFPNIVEEVPMDAEEFVKAIQDAIADAASGAELPRKLEPAITESVPAIETEPDQEPEVYEIELEAVIYDDTEDNAEDLVTKIHDTFAGASTDKQNAAKAVMKSNGVRKIDVNTPIEILKEIMNALD